MNKIIVIAAIAVLISGAWANLHRMQDDGSLIIRTDDLSGCQYLESSAGFLTPRMDLDGLQICDSPE